MSASDNDRRYGELIYGGDIDSKLAFFQKYIVGCFPPAYILPEFRDFWERFLYCAAQDLAFFNDVFDRLPDFINASSAPEGWVDWMIGEWWGFRLIPPRLPLASDHGGPSRRRLLSNLHLHYKRRYTKAGLIGLLAEFGIISDVIDEPAFVGSFVGDFAVSGPLSVWVRSIYYAPWDPPPAVFVGTFVGDFLEETTCPISHKFVEDLCEWNRPAGVTQAVEHVMDDSGFKVDAHLFEELVQLEINAPTVNESDLTE
jgi:hypothetical protein